jgi:protein-L-isoaspartate(D-aspartate) O-methyltransferase
MAQNHMNYAKARQAMVDSQIHPMGVVSDDILDAFLQVPREQFVPDALKNVCYCDEDIKVAPGRYLMEPSVFSRMLQEAHISKDDVVLTIGSGIGYNAAVLSYLCSTVVALEEDEEMVATAQEQWDRLGYTNIAAISGKLGQGAPAYAPYDIILFNGAVSKVPEQIRKQLTVGGKLLVITRENAHAVGKAMLIQRTDDNNFSSRQLFDTGTPYLNGFMPDNEFVF